MRPCLLASALGACLTIGAWGCAGTRIAAEDPVTPWPNALKQGEGAVLFGANISPPTQSLDWFTGYAAMFYAAGDPSRVARVWVKLSEGNSRPVDDLFLIAMPAGSYANTNVLAILPRGSPFAAVPGDSFQSFSVRPGEVTVLGTINASIDVAKSTTGFLSPRFSAVESDTSWNRSVGSDVDKNTKLKLIDAALGRSRSSTLWASALSAARDAEKARGEVAPAAAPPAAPPRACVPGQSVACAGPGGCQGFQVCADDGARFQPCACSQ